MYYTMYYKMYYNFFVIAKKNCLKSQLYCKKNFW